MENIKYVLFDLDGTLTDPSEGITNSVAYALLKYSIEVEDKSELCDFIGPPLINSFMKYYGFSKEEAKQAVDYYREYFSVKGIFENRIYDGIIPLLDSLKKAGKGIILATSKPEKFAVQILKHFGIWEYFYFVGGATMDEKRTEKEEVIEYILNELDLKEKSSIIMVGDRRYDIEGAHKNGIKAIGVEYGFGSKEELQSAKADFFARTCEDLRTILNLD